MAADEGTLKKEGDQEPMRPTPPKPHKTPPSRSQGKDGEATTAARPKAPPAKGPQVSEEAKLEETADHWSPGTADQAARGQGPSADAEATTECPEAIPQAKAAKGEVKAKAKAAEQGPAESDEAARDPETVAAARNPENSAAAWNPANSAAAWNPGSAVAAVSVMAAGSVMAAA